MSQARYGNGQAALRRMGSLNYRSVTIFKQERLGSGSFGAVYKAKCDELPCAAKVLHPTLMDPDDTGRNTLMQKFEQECRFMDSIRHPNIVLYLGMHTDPHTRLPALLMELLDENLTFMLENSPHDIPYHIQVDICHDVSLALSYLHSLNILHRDLSSNNILLTAKRKAKVTDFGVSKMVDFERHSVTPLSLCPGTKVYMPPEAFKQPTTYTNKLDVFSMGVVIIQLLTRLFPSPTSLTKVVEDSSNYHGQQLHVVVSEVERRKNHLDLIDPNNPLRETAVLCLHKEQNDRPNADELCQIVARFKTSPTYRESKSNDHLFEMHHGGYYGSDVQGSNGTKGSDDMLLKKKFKEQEEPRAKMRVSLSQQEDSSKMQMEIEKKNKELTDTVQQLRKKNKTLEEELQEKKSQLVSLRSELYTAQHEKEESVRARDEMFRVHQSTEHVIGEYKHEMKEKDVRIQQLSAKLQENEMVTADFQTTIQDLQNSLRHSSLSSPTNSPTLPSPRLQYRRQSSLEKLTVQWRTTQSAPSAMYRGTSAFHDGTVYFACKCSVFAYNTTAPGWKELPNSPQPNGALVMINEFPTMIGGEKNGKVVNSLVSLMGDTRECKWVESCPNMPTARVYSSAIVCNDHVIVAGGSSSTKLEENIIATVEVMEIGEFKCMWFSVSNLCTPLADACPVLHQGQLMLIGGTDCFGNTTTNLKCTIRELLDTKTKAKPSTPTSLPPLSSSLIWRQLSDNRLQYSSAVEVKGHMLAIGGTSVANGKKTCTSYMYRYNDMNDVWEKAGLMKMARSQCFAVSLPGNEIMVFGGYTSNPSILTNMADIATIL